MILLKDETSFFCYLLIVSAGFFLYREDYTCQIIFFVSFMLPGVDWLSSVVFLGAPPASLFWQFNKGQHLAETESASCWSPAVKISFLCLLTGLRRITPQCSLVFLTIKQWCTRHFFSITMLLCFSHLAFSIGSLHFSL